ncbi:MAG: diheme cytochrome c-553 [Saprospiraceae bacterium]
MKNVVIISLVILANAAMFLAACNEEEQKESTSYVPTKEELRKRGEYLVGVIGCDDCHTPKVMGPNGPELVLERRLSGHPMDVPVSKVDTSVLSDWMYFRHDLTAAVGPWGVSFAANLTSDETGIGNWSEAQFFKAIREGKSKGMDDTRPLLPPMPWFVYKNMSNEDLRAIFTFLKSTKPVHNIVPKPLSVAEVAE